MTRSWLWKQAAKSWRRRAYWVRDSRDKWKKEAQSASAFINVNANNSFEEFRTEWLRLKRIERLVKDTHLICPDRIDAVLKELIV